METKNQKFCFRFCFVAKRLQRGRGVLNNARDASDKSVENDAEVLQERIVSQSIVGLQKEGLRFSVDSVARQLKISKKTVYKYFPTKEQLAYAIYDRFYSSAFCKAQTAEKLSRAERVRMLLQLYYESSLMTDETIFNKYALNLPIKDFALKKHLQIWKMLESCIEQEGESVRSLKIIVDGAFSNLGSEKTVTESTIELLTRLLV